ncbi:MAG: hypothetical protein HYT37_02500 [Candidatus Sungbacteria bacterium]|nr:hypothetical protein [Candidatus Sungbacteria bacterium]
MTILTIILWWLCAGFSSVSIILLRDYVVKRRNESHGNIHGWWIYSYYSWNYWRFYFGILGGFITLLLAVVPLIEIAVLQLGFCKCSGRMPAVNR